MVLINSTAMQAMAKIVYYGPGLCGKTTNLHQIHSRTDPGSRGEMISLETETDRTLFFDLLPLEVGTIRGLKVRLQLYTVPGQVFYNATRKMVLKNVDGIVFVADSQDAALEANLASLENLRSNLLELGSSLDAVPWVLQYNKRDLPEILPVETLERELNRSGAPHFEAEALHGRGVFETLKGISKLALEAMRQKVAAVSPSRSHPGIAVASHSTPTPPLVSRGSEDTEPMPALTDAATATRVEPPVQRARLVVPAAVLSGAARVGVHLSFQGDEVTFKDALTLRLSPADRQGRLRLRLELEVDADDAE